MFRIKRAQQGKRRHQGNEKWSHVIHQTGLNKSHMLTAKAGSLGLDFLVYQVVWQNICVLRPQYTTPYLRNKDLSPPQYYWGTGNSTELWSDWPWCYWQREEGGPLSHVNKIQAAQGRLARSEWEGWSGEFHKHCLVNSTWESFRNSSTEPSNLLGKSRHCHMEGVWCYPRLKSQANLVYKSAKENFLVIYHSHNLVVKLRLKAKSKSICP